MPGSTIKNIEQVVNELLQLDEEYFEKLVELHGKCIAIEITGFNFTIYLNITGQGIEISQVNERPADVTISASALTYVQLVMRNRDEQTVSPGDMNISGDAGLAQQFQSLIKGMEIDWEEYISQWTGDYVAHKAGNLVRDTRKYIKETREMIGMDISEYLRYEKGQLPDQTEVSEFISAVDIIRNDVERLQQRLARIDRHLLTGNS